MGFLVTSFIQDILQSRITTPAFFLQQNIRPTYAVPQQIAITNNLAYKKLKKNNINDFRKLDAIKEINKNTMPVYTTNSYLFKSFNITERNATF